MHLGDEMINNVLLPPPIVVSLHLCLLSALPLASLSVVQTSSLPSISLPPLPFTDLPLFSCPSSFPAEEDREPLSPGSANAAEIRVRLVLL